MESPGHPASATPEKAASPRYSAELVEDWDRLASLSAEWDALAEDAVEASPSSETWMLLPSLRRLAMGSAVKVLVVRASDAATGDGLARLCGVFPLEIRSSFRGLPIRTLSIWNHAYSLFPAPLLRAETADECIRALFKWAAAAFRAPFFVRFPELRTDSAFFHHLSQVVHADALTHHVDGLSTRAVFHLRHDAQGYLDQISTVRLRRYERRLSEMGALAYDELTADSSVDTWLGEFMALEMGGWKGRSATAIGSDDNHRAWLLEVGTAAAARGRLMMLALRLDGRAIAMKLNFRVPGGGYAFKTAYDETYSRYSPGILLELEQIRRLHAKPDISWMDSLAGPDHSLANRVWRDRTSVATLLVAPAGLGSGMALSLLPLLRWAKRLISPKR
jgi:CelD/BcsL family acetyltransferase involved in cellulose biosynthesis